MQTTTFRLSSSETAPALRGGASSSETAPALRGGASSGPDDGVSQFVYRWSPDAGPAKAAVLIAHGMGEHAGRYTRVAEQLTGAGYVVYAGDHRGHGKTAGGPSDLGYFADENGWQRTVQDLHRIRARIEQEHPQLPLVVFGHSMGSMLVRSYMAEHGAGVAALVLSGTNGGVAAPSRVGRLVARAERLRIGPRGRSPLLQLLIVAPYNLQFRPTRTDCDWLSRDALEVDKYIADPLCGSALTTQGWIDFLGGIIDIERDATIGRIPKSIPIYLFSGDRCPVGGNTRGVRWLIDKLRRAGVNDVTHRFYPGGRHEMLNETNRVEVQNDLIAWLDAALARCASRAA